MTVARCMMAVTSAAMSSLLLLLLAGLASAASGATAADRPMFTVPASADEGQPLIPWVRDPEAVDPQAVCPRLPGRSRRGADGTGRPRGRPGSGRAGLQRVRQRRRPPCPEGRVSGRRPPARRDPAALHRPRERDVVCAARGPGAQAGRAPDWESRTLFSAGAHSELQLAWSSDPVFAAASAGADSDFEFAWSNDPVFAFTVKRRATGDVLFTTNGTKLVYEDQFIEFASPLPENYNLYGLGEVIHGFRLGNNLTRASREASSFFDFSRESRAAADRPGRNHLCGRRSRSRRRQHLRLAPRLPRHALLPARPRDGPRRPRRQRHRPVGPVHVVHPRRLPA